MRSQVYKVFVTIKNVTLIRYMHVQLRSLILRDYWLKQNGMFKF